MDIKKIKELIALMKDNDLVDLEIEEEGRKIKLARLGSQGNIVPAVLPQPVSSPLQPAPESRETASAEKNSGLLEIKAPMVGTFYRAPAPNAASYVEVGSKIKEGDVLCIIEAMKLMNEIKSEISGEIVEIVPENAQPLEFGQVLFLVKPL